ncbi:unnamed protein product [Dibothriocephalus latus]|uniref:Uncharacterized protein n=1 Tax=Dibothriocephalus latus TaxID=60516 RepID=A0A3P6TNG4_DIBLA|nr:unnamed protein product [Dibothriocephalus latus]
MSIGSDEAPCKAPNFCWQLVSRRQYAIIEGKLAGENGAAIFYPLDRRQQPVALVYKRWPEWAVPSEEDDNEGNGGFNPILPSNVKVLNAIYVSPDQEINQRLIFDSEIRSVYVVGSMVLKPTPESQFLLHSTWNTHLKDILFVTGRMNTTVLKIMITMADETSATIPLLPSPLPPQSEPIYVSWSVDNAIATAGKQTKTLFQCLNECQRKYYQYLG